MRLQDVADVEDSVQDVRNAGFADGKPAVMLIVFKQPQANIIDTVDHIRDGAAVAGGIGSPGDSYDGHGGPDDDHSRLGS